MASRREFLAAAAAAASGVGLGMGGRTEPGESPQRAASALQRSDLGQEAISPAPRPLSLLMLGGTGFLGPAEVAYALARGHRVTLFNRGRTNPHLFPEAEKLQGDRATGDLAALRGRRWDAVLDTSANLATWVRDSAAVLKDAVGRYLFVSSLSAHADNSDRFTYWPVRVDRGGEVLAPGDGTETPSARARP